MTFEIEVQILKMTLPQKNGHRIKTPSSKRTILCHLAGKRILYAIMHTNFSLLSLVFLKLLIASVAFFLGHPVYRPKQNISSNRKTSLVILTISINNKNIWWMQPCPCFFWDTRYTGRPKQNLSSSKKTSVVIPTILTRTFGDIWWT